jgi:DNA-binding transcriptional ArsR family regulator
VPQVNSFESEVLERASQMLRVVAHPVRIEIINLLVNKKELSVGEIRYSLNISQSMTSQHLAALRNVKVVTCSKEANVCRYSILNRNILKLLDCVKKCAAGQTM